MRLKFRPIAFAVLAIAVAPTPAMAQYGPWGGGAWGRSAWDSPMRSNWRDRTQGNESIYREGHVEVSRFVSKDAADQLQHGHITVDASVDGFNDSRSTSTYAAAVENQMANLGYDTIRQETNQGQIAEVRVYRDIAQPAEQKRSPVSGETTVGVSNRGSFVGMALNVDLSKPRTALLSTRLMARILDAKSGDVLWEGRATVYTRDGDDDYSEQAIATRLSTALFSQFPVGPDDDVVEK